jgi:GntR family transcriptional regulator/MocR family aminotransferase
MYLQLDGNGSLHAQLTRALKTAMLGGLVKGARLPSSRSLARELGLSRNTVLAAYEQLRAEGFIDGRVSCACREPLPSSCRYMRSGSQGLDWHL